MRILHIVSADLWGGAESQVAALVKSSVSLETQVAVALLNVDSELARRIRPLNVAMLELDESTTGAFRLVLELRRFAKQFRPDVIHTHRFKENIIGTLIAYLAGVPSVRTAHGAAEPELLRSTARRRVLDAVDTFVASHLQHAVIAVSQQLSEKLRIALPRARVHVIHNGVDVAELRARAHDEPVLRTCGKSRIGFFGRFVPVKRLDLLLEAARDLRDSYTDGFELFLVGDGPERPAMESLVDKLKLRAHVHFPGFQSNAAAWINSMDCVVLTSDHEGLPMIILECLALEIPVVARAVGGIPEVLQKINPEWLVHDSTPTAIAARLAVVLGSLQGDGRDRAQLPELYTSKAMAKAYLRLYQQVTRRVTLPPRRTQVFSDHG